jgi:hypothetical protein
MRRRIAALRWGTPAAPIVVASAAAVGLAVRTTEDKARRAHTNIDTDGVRGDFR